MKIKGELTDGKWCCYTEEEKFKWNSEAEIELSVADLARQLTEDEIEKLAQEKFKQFNFQSPKCKEE